MTAYTETTLTVDLTSEEIRIFRRAGEVLESILNHYCDHGIEDFTVGVQPLRRGIIELDKAASLLEDMGSTDFLTGRGNMKKVE